MQGTVQINDCSSAQASFMSLIEQMFLKIPRLLRCSFISSFLIFLLIHGYCFSNLFMNRDNALFGQGIGGLYSLGGGVESGRFLLSTANAISSNYSMPWLTGILCAVYFAITVCCIISLFQIKHKSSIFLISALLASFPTAASTLSYMYTADSYFLAMCFATLAALLACNYRYGWLPGTVLIMASLALYQAYFPFAAALMVFSLLFSFLEKKASTKEILLRCIKSLFTLVAGLLLYKYVLDLILQITGKELDSYAGIDHMWYTSIWIIQERLSTAWRYSLLFFRTHAFYAKYVYVFYLCALFSFLILVLLRIVQERIYAQPFRLLTLIGLLLCAPVACSLVFLMCEGVHMCMVYAVALQLIAAVVLLDHASCSLHPKYIYIYISLCQHSSRRFSCFDLLSEHHCGE